MELKDHYRHSVMNALGGFQLLEEHLKNYLDMYYRSVRHLLQGKLHFDYQRADINDAPLGRLIGVFSKVCSNTDLVSHLRSLVKHRDNSAHRALVCLYKTDTADDQLHEMIRANHALSDDVGEALSMLQAEFNAMRKATFGEQP